MCASMLLCEFAPTYEYMQYVSHHRTHRASMGQVLKHFGGKESLVQWVKDIVHAVQPDRVGARVDPSLTRVLASLQLVCF